VPDTSRNNFVNLATTSRSLLQTEFQHKTRGSNSGGGDFRRSCRPSRNKISRIQKSEIRKLLIQVFVFGWSSGAA
jgi:hypothetical protein